MAPPTPLFEFRHYTSAASLQAPLGREVHGLEALGDACQLGATYRHEMFRIRGKWRNLSIPTRELGVVQHSIGRLLFPVDLALSEVANGYIARRSTLSNATPHVGAQYLQKFDILDFFANVTLDQIHEAFVAVGFGPEAARLLSRLVTDAGNLPLGATTSPRVSNLVLWDFDEAIISLIGNTDVVYTRYADDLSFTSPDPFDVSSLVLAELTQRGFKLNPSKTRVFKRGQPMFVTGLSVSDAVRPRVRRGLKRQLRRELYFIEKHGVASHANATGQEPGSVASRVRGQLYYLRSIEPDVVAHLSVLYPGAFNALLPERSDTRIERAKQHRDRFLQAVLTASPRRLEMYEPSVPLTEAVP